MIIVCTKASCTADNRIFIYPKAFLADFYIEISDSRNSVRQDGACLEQAMTLELSRTNHSSFCTWLRLELILFSEP